MYPRREELRFVESKDTFTEDAYNQFLSNRKEIIIKEFMRRLFNIHD
jgi:hypothetical protein